MSNWKVNPIMTWNGTKVTDHGRSPLSMSTERIGTDKRMANGTLRRHHVIGKRSWSCSWENLPSRNDVVGSFKTADGQLAGGGIEDFYNTQNGEFTLVLRNGSAIDLTAPSPSTLPYEDDDFIVCKVMITEYSRETIKRGNVDLWNISITLEEV